MKNRGLSPARCTLPYRHSALLLLQPPRYSLCDTGLQLNSNSAKQYQESVTSFMPQTVLGSLYLYLDPSLAPLAPSLT